MASPEIESLTQALSKLPGLGPRSARRAVLYLLKRRETAMGPLLRALEAVNEALETCSVCGNVDTTNPCSICSDRSEEHTSELQSLMRISYAVFCLKKKNNIKQQNQHKINFLDNTTMKKIIY